MTTIKNRYSWYLLKGVARKVKFGHAIHKAKHAEGSWPFWVLGFVCSGEMSLQIGDDRAVLGPGGYYLIPPDTHHFGLRTEDKEVYYLNFAMDSVRNHLPSKVCSDQILLPVFLEPQHLHSV